MNLTSQTEMIPRTTLISSFWRRRLKKKKETSPIVFTKTARTPQREKKRQKYRGRGARERNDGNKI